MFSGAHPAAPPEIINHQGRITINGTNLHGTGEFKNANVREAPETVSTAAATASVTGGFVTTVAVDSSGDGHHQQWESHCHHSGQC